MTQKYFDKFPIISYSNTQAVDITKRTALLERVSRNPYVFYPYEITEGERPDQLSYRYYNNPYNSWILYITNKIVDPYYEWYLNEEQFYEFVEKKYGSFIVSQRKIKHYVNDWFQQSNISVSDYDALPNNMQNYWEPVTTGNRVVEYTRKQVNWQAVTNKIVCYTVSDASNFIQDEICEVFFDSYNSGKGQVCFASGTQLCIRHVSGQYDKDNSKGIVITPTSHIVGSESRANTTFSTVEITAVNIKEEELIYWKPLTYYQYEYDKNEFNKTVRVIDSKFKQTVVDNLTDLMSK